MLCAYPVCVCLRYAKPVFPTQFGMAVQTDAKLWMGELDPNMDDNYLTQLWASVGYIVSARVIREKGSNMSQGYGFVNFQSLQHAQAAVASMNGQPIPGVPGKYFKLNWAHNSAMSATAVSAQQYPPDAPTTGDEFSVFVGDLSREVSDQLLYTTFASRYVSTKNAKVVVDAETGFTKGYGFVRFVDPEEGRRAIAEMQGVHLGGRSIRLNEATPRNNKVTSTSSTGSSSAPPPGYMPEADPNNTTVFVGNIEGLGENDLRMAFSPFGTITSIRIPGARTCGFVVFLEKWSATQAIASMNGQWVGHTQIRCAWGKHTNTAPRPAAMPQMGQFGAYGQQPYGAAMGGMPQQPAWAGYPGAVPMTGVAGSSNAAPEQQLPEPEKSKFEDITQEFKVEEENDAFVEKHLKTSFTLEVIGWPVEVPAGTSSSLQTVLDSEVDGPSSVL